MARHVYERTQKGNPYQLPVKQHVLPARSIARFVNSRGLVNLYDLTRRQTRVASPGDTMFCAMRAWDLRAERTIMKPIEDEFQELADRIILGRVATIGEEDKGRVDRFFGLWKWRGYFRSVDLQEVQFNSVTGWQWTKDQEEEFEKAGALFLREGGKMPAHRLNGIKIQMAIDCEQSVLSTVRWGIVQAGSGQFLVPDIPTILYVPLHPTLCLLGGKQEWMAGARLTRKNVVSVNRDLSSGCKAYYFSNDLTECL